MAATLLCLVCMVPPVLIGGMAKSVDWSNSTHFEALSESSSIVLPVALAQLVPYPVAMGGLAAVRYFSGILVRLELFQAKEALAQWTEHSFSTEWDRFESSMYKAIGKHK